VLIGQPQHFDVRPQSRPFQGQGNPLDALRRMSADEEAAEAVGKGALLSSRPQNESPMWKPARHFSSVVEKPIADSDSPSMTKDPQGDGSDGVNQKGVERSGSKTVNMSGQQEPALESSGDQVGNTDLVEKAGGEPVEATQNLQKSSEKPEKASSRGSVTPRRLTRGLSKNSSIQSSKQGSLKPVEAVLPSLRKSSAAGKTSCDIIQSRAVMSHVMPERHCTTSLSHLIVSPPCLTLLYHLSVSPHYTTSSLHIKY